jgi:Flp pilus assembly protein TadG
MRPTWLRREDGQAAAEMAMVLPILCALILAIAQFGIAFNNYVTLTDATRAGARKAATARFTGDQGVAAKAAVYSAAADLKAASLDVTVSVDNDDWTTPGNNVTVTATYPYSINILGWVVKSGNLTSTTQERLE